MNHREVMETASGVELDVYADRHGSGRMILGYSSAAVAATCHLTVDEAEKFAQLILRGVEAARNREKAA